MGTWSPVIQFAHLMRTGTHSVAASNTITFDPPFPDTNYTISLTPFVSEAPTGIPMVWVIDNKELETITSSSFQIGISGCDGVYWTVIYNPPAPGPGPPGLG